MIISNSIFKKKIQKSFSDAAIKYDDLTELHRRIGLAIVEQLAECQIVGNVLDIGMGTGWMTELIKLRLPSAHVIGLDFAAGMLQQALQKRKNIQLVQADAVNLPFKKGVFDTITSNLALQWIPDLKQTFKEVSRVLKKNGNLSLSVFGHKTFHELFESFEQSANNDKFLHLRSLRSLPTENEFNIALRQNGFKNINIKHETYESKFNNVMDILKWTKNIGANQIRENIFLGKEMIQQSNRYYSRRFGNENGIPVKFEVIRIEAKNG